jgi:putative methylase
LKGALVGRLAKLLEEAAPRIPSPRRELEQYTTPADLALRLASHAAVSGLLDDSSVADLAAGSCRLALAFLMMGASRAAAVEVDGRLSDLCLGAARRLGLEDRLVFIESRISGSRGPLRRGAFEIVVTNPPFGVVRRGADWEILSYALALEPLRVYAILKSGNIKFHEREAAKRGYTASLLFKERFPIPASMPMHRSRVRWIDVDIVLFERRV